jgi:tRNA C32,U32 (ribose-2'-O)-methylase TrmJ
LINFNKFEKNQKNIKISSKRKISSLVLHLKQLLEKKGFFVPSEKKHSMLMNINNLIYRLEPNDKEVRILASIISSLSKKNINPN